MGVPVPDAGGSCAAGGPWKGPAQTGGQISKQNLGGRELGAAMRPRGEAETAEERGERTGEREKKGNIWAGQGTRTSVGKESALPNSQAPGPHSTWEN